MNKAICMVVSGVGATIGITLGLVACFGLGALFNSVPVGLIPLIIVALLIAWGVIAAWWALSKWLHAHCREYWNK